jgi:uncharacterized protein YbjT (DUF2867 family)
MKARNAWIAGATGVVGGYCLDALLADPVYGDVQAFTRRPLSRTDARLTTNVVDFDRLASLPTAPPVDDAYCCLGTTMKQAGSRAAFERVDYEYVCAYAELAARNGASQFLLVSAVGANARSSIYYSRVKGRAEDTVQAMAFRGVHLFRPSLLMGPRPEQRRGEAFSKTIAPLFAPLLLGPLARYRPVHACDVALRMIAVAKQDQSGRHVHYFTE